MPYQKKGDKVVGREDTLERVRQQLLSGQRTNIGQAIAFQGLGGLGKTQLAVEYAFRYEKSYPGGVIWLNADQNIDAQLIELVDQAQWIAPESEHKDKLAVARQRLKIHANCLVIFDNVDSFNDIEEYLSLLNPDTHILATSRIELVGFDPIFLDILDVNLSYKLLIQEANREPGTERNKAAALEIVQTLGGLPLAIELAGAFLRYRPTFEWHEYRDILSKNLKEAFPKKFAQATHTKHKADLYSTLKINEALLNDEPRLRDILDLLTWSGSAPMGKNLLLALMSVKDFSEIAVSLNLGLNLRLLQKTRDAESYSIHRLVREVRREDVPLQGRESWASSTCKKMGDWFQQLREEYSDLPTFDAEIDHLKAWHKNALEYAPEHTSRLTWLQAYPPFHRGQYSEALQLINEAFEHYEKANNLELKAHLLNDLAVIQASLGNIQDEKRLLEDALHIRQELFGDKNSDVAMSLNNVGNAFGRFGDYKKQLEYSQRALAIRQELFGDKHPDVAMSLNNVGVAFGSLGDHKKELEYHQKALAIRQELFGDKHPDIAMSLNNVGNAFGSLGDYKKQLGYISRSWEMLRELLGETHPNALLIQLNLAVTYFKMGDKPSANRIVEPLMRQVPKELPLRSDLERFRKTLLAKPIQKGHRQQPVNPGKRKKGKKKR